MYKIKILFDYKFVFFLYLLHSLFKMSVDKFGRYSHETKSANVKGSRGEGFNLDPEGNFDIQNKRLCNVSDPTADEDAVNLRTLKRNASNFLSNDGSSFDAKKQVITNIGDAVNEHDAINLKYLKTNTITRNKYNKLDVNNLVISNVGLPSDDTDAVTVKFLKNHTLYLNKDIDAKKKHIKNVAKPKDAHDAVNYVYLMEVLATLSFAIYLKLNENKKRKFTRSEWITKVLSNLQDWNELFEVIEN